MTRVLIRADASATTGAGHVMRCLALAQAWIDAGADVTWVSASLLSVWHDRLAAEKIPVTIQPGDPSSRRDAEATADLAARIGADWVVLDGYSFDVEHQRVLKSAGRRVLFADDASHAAQYCADIVLNQNVYANARLYEGKDDGAVYLLGPRHALLRREFRTLHVGPRNYGARPRKLLVLFGGGGDAAATRLVLDALRLLDSSRRFDVRLVLGSGVAPGEIDLTGIGEWLTVSSTLSDVPPAMVWADIALSAAGTTVYELMRMGVPTLMTVNAENQRPVAAAVHEMGVARNLGDRDRLTSEAVADALDSLANDGDARRRMSQQAMSLVDGQGADRVRRAMQAALFTLRRAGRDDARRLWEWANDPDARAASFSTAAIPWDDHLRWYEAQLREARNIIYVAESATSPIGVVRFELRDRQAVISVTVDGAARHEGYGRWLIRRASLEVLKTAGIDVVNAYIKTDNEASVKAFEGAGFRGRTATLVHGQPAWLLTLTAPGPETHA